MSSRIISSLIARLTLQMILFVVHLHATLCLYADTNDGVSFSSQDATIHETVRFDTGRTVYHIQDAHCHPDAQFAIARILQEILTHHPDAIVSVEGAAGTISAPALREFPNKTARQDVASHFIETGSISGAEYFYITASQQFRFIGVEDPNLYRKNYALILAALDNHSDAAEFMDSIAAQVHTRCATIMSDEEIKFVGQWKTYHSDNGSLAQYITYLAGYIGSDTIGMRYPSLAAFLDICRKEKQIQFQAVEQQRLAFLDWITRNAPDSVISDIFKTDIQYKLHKISPDTYFEHIGAYIDQFQDQLSPETVTDIAAYIDLLKASRDINKKQLHAELRKAINHCTNILLRNTESQDLFTLLQYTAHYRDLIKLAIDSGSLRALHDGRSVAWLMQSLAVHDIKLQPDDVATIECAVSRAHQFYATAHQRDNVLASNLLDQMDEHGAHVGVIITGGFHRDGVCDYLREHNVSYTSIEPAIHRSNVANNYFSLISNRRSGLEKWVQQSTLAVASWLAETPLVNPEIKQTRTQIFSTMLVSAHIRSMSTTDRQLISDNMDAFIAKVNATLLDWQVIHSPSIDVKTIEFIGPMLSVTLSLNDRELVFLFTGSGSRYPIDKKEFLEIANLGDDSVGIVTTQVFNRLKTLAQASSLADNYIYDASVVEQTCSTLGLTDQFHAQSLTVPELMTAYRAYNAGHYRKLSVNQLYDTIHFILNTTGNEIPLVDIAQQPFDRTPDTTLFVSDLFKETLNLLRNTTINNPIIPVDDLSTDWKHLFKARNISMFVIDPGLPFESLSAMLFMAAFNNILRPGAYDPGEYHADTFQVRVSTRIDGSMLVRMGFTNPAETTDLFWSSSSASTLQNQLPLPLHSGVISLELDGGFALSNVLTYTHKATRLEPTQLTLSANGIARGETGVQHITWLLDRMRNQAMKEGIVIRGYIIKNQESKPEFFATEQDIIDYYSSHAADYIFPAQSNWISTAGTMTEREFVKMAEDNNVRSTDEAEGFFAYRAIESHVSLAGKSVLEVGSQSGKNVFYSYLKGAAMSVGIDFNPYTIRISREIAAYIHEQAQIPEVTFAPLSHDVLKKDAPTYGTLFFRTQVLKTEEQETGERFSHKPPENIEFAVADARSMHYADDSFDVVNALNILGYIDRASDALKEMLRVTAPGGVIQFNYRFKQEELVSLLEEAAAILADETGMQVEYSILEQSCGLPVGSDAMLIRITAKVPVSTPEAVAGVFKNHVDKQIVFPNNFDAKPYLQSINRPIDIFPSELKTIATVSRHDLASVTGVDKSVIFNLMFAFEMIEQQFGAEYIDAISTIRIQHGALQFAELHDRMLTVHPAALANPYILFSQLILLIYEQQFNAIPEETLITGDLPAEFADIYRTAAAVQSAAETIRKSLDDQQYELLITRLTSITNVDTPVERSAQAFGQLLRELPLQFTDDQATQRVLTAVYAMPEYSSVHGLLERASPDIKYGTIDSEFLDMAVAGVELVHDTSAPLREIYPFAKTISPGLVAELAGYSQQITTLKPLFEVIPWRTKLLSSTRHVPLQVSALLTDASLAGILSSAPAVGKWVVIDRIKSVLDNPLYPPRANFLLDLSSRDILELIRHLEPIYARSPDDFESLMRDSQHFSYRAGAHAVNQVLRTQTPAKTLQSMQEKKIITDNLTEKETAWRRFLPYLEQITANPDVLTDTTRSLFLPDHLDVLYSNYPQTGFYILTELAKALLDNRNDPSELPFLKNIDADTLFSIIEQLDSFITAPADPYQRPGISGISGLPVEAWIGPKMHNTLIELNNGKPYHTITLETQLGIETVEAANELYEQFLWEVQQQQIDPESIVMIKMYDSTYDDDDVETGTLMIVAEQLKNIHSMTDLINIRMSSGSKLGEYLFMFKTHFVPQEHTMGDISTEDGDYDWHISFKDDAAKNRGLGSEFLHTHYSLLHLMGLHGTTDYSTARGIPMLTILNNELQPDFIDELHDDAPVGYDSQLIPYAHLLGRMGLLMADDLQFISDNPDDKQQIKDRIAAALNKFKAPQTSFVDYIVRSAHRTIGQLTRLEKIMLMYEVLLDDPQVRASFPFFADIYEPMAEYRAMQQDPHQFSANPSAIQFERFLLDHMNDYERTIIDYMKNDRTGVLSRHEGIFEITPDQRQIYMNFNDYFESCFSYIRMEGALPLTIPAADKPYAARAMLVRAQRLANTFNTARVTEALLADDPWSKINTELTVLRNVDNLKWALNNLARSILRKSAPEWINDLMARVLDTMESAQLPVDTFVARKTEYVERFTAHPLGSWRLLAYCFAHGFSRPEDIRTLVSHITKMDEARLDTLLGLLASKQTARTSLRSLTVTADMIRFGIYDALRSLHEQPELFGRSELMRRDDTRIVPDNAQAGSFVISGVERSVVTGTGTDSFESARYIRSLFGRHNIKSSIVQGRLPGSSHSDFFVRAGRLIIGTAPYLPMFVDTLEDERDVTVQQPPQKLIFNDQPLYFEQQGDGRGILFSGDVRKHISHGRNLVDISVTTTVYDGFKPTGETATYILRLPPHTLVTMREELEYSFRPDILQIVRTIPSVYLGLADGSGAVGLSESTVSLIGDLMTELVLKLDPVWIMSQRRSHLLSNLQSMTADQVQDSFDRIPYDESPAHLIESFTAFQYDILTTADPSIDQNIVREQNEYIQPDILTLDSVPVGWIAADGTVTLATWLPEAVTSTIMAQLDQAVPLQTPFQRQQRTDGQLTVLVTLSIDEQNHWQHDFSREYDYTAFPVARYTRALEQALLSFGKLKNDLAENNITLQLVHDAPFLVKPLPLSADGTQTIMIDADTFQHAALLRFALRHALDMPGAATAQEMIGNELIMFMADIEYFAGLHPQERSELLEALNDPQINNTSLAQLLESAYELPPRDRFDTSLDFVLSSGLYADVLSMLPSANHEALGAIVNSVARPDVAHLFLTAGVDPYSTAAAVTTRHARTVPRIAELLDYLRGIGYENTPSLTDIATILNEGGTYRLNEFVDLFFTSLAQKPASFTDYGAVWSDLFALYGSEAVPALLAQIQSDHARIERVSLLLRFFEDQFGPRYTAEIEAERSGFKCLTQFQENDLNIVRTYDMDGTLLDEQRIQTLPYDIAVHQLVVDQAHLSELYFGEDIDRMIVLFEQMLETDDPDTFNRYLDEANSLNDAFIKRYPAYPRADVSIVPVSRQDDAQSIVRQFASDLLGSPLGAVSMSIQLIAESSKDEISESSIKFLQRGLRIIRSIRREMVAYRMLNEYVISPLEKPMILFDDTMVLEENKPFAALPVATDKDMVQAVQHQLESAQGTEWYVLYVPEEINDAVTFLYQIMAARTDRLVANIAIVSPNHPSFVIEDMLTAADINFAPFVIIGEECFETLGPAQELSADDLVRLASLNCQTTPGNLVFLTGRIDMFSKLVSQRMTVLPTPELRRNIPRPALRRVVHYKLIDEAA